MGYRQVVIKKSDKIRTENNNLVVIKGEKENKIPMEDINFVILEDNQTVITGKLLSSFGENGICFIACNDKYEPVSIMYPYNYHFKQLENIEYQLNLNSKEELKGKIWQEIIVQKIESEIAVLCQTSKDERVISILENYAKEVGPGDKTNREGLAAKLYFRSLFGNEFIRFYDDSINHALNYCYQIIKSSIIRTLSIYGLNTYLGVNHKSKVNNFNLAYDLIEPYRAIADKYVYALLKDHTSELSFELRKQLINILNYPVVCENKKCSLEYSIELLIKSYIKTISSGEVKLSFPKLIE